MKKAMVYGDAFLRRICLFPMVLHIWTLFRAMTANSVSLIFHSLLLCIPYPEKYWTTEVYLDGLGKESTAYLFSVEK